MERNKLIIGAIVAVVAYYVYNRKQEEKYKSCGCGK
jgi:hypothetical protein